MALVIKQWSSTPTPGPDGVYIRIVGREAGFFAWFLALIKIDPTTHIEGTKDLASFENGSFEGFEKRIIPLSSVCSAYYGYKKPLKEAIILTIALLPLFGLGLIVGPIYYFLNKTLSLGFIENSGWVGGISFKRSVIEGKNISEDDAKMAIDIVRGLIEKRAS